MSVEDLAPAIQDALNNKVLPRLEVRELIHRCQRGDRAAMDKLVRHNMKLVYLVAKRYTFAHNLEDLMQEGMLGLMKAVQDFDLSTNNTLATYAKWWISAFVKRAAQKYTGMGGINPGGPRRHMVVNHDDIFVSTSAPVGDTDDMQFGDMLQDQGPWPDEVAIREELRLQIRNVIVLEAKNTREVAVTRRIADRKDPAFELGRLGEQFGVSRERIRQVEVKVKERLAASVKLKRLAKVAL